MHFQKSAKNTFRNFSKNFSAFGAEKGGLAGPIHPPTPPPPGTKTGKNPWWARGHDDTMGDGRATPKAANAGWGAGGGRGTRGEDCA